MALSPILEITDGVDYDDIGDEIFLEEDEDPIGEEYYGGDEDDE